MCVNVDMNIYVHTCNTMMNSTISVLCIILLSIVSIDSSGEIYFSYRLEQVGAEPGVLSQGLPMSACNWSITIYISNTGNSGKFKYIDFYPPCEHVILWC